MNTPQKSQKENALHPEYTPDNHCMSDCMMLPGEQPLQLEPVKASLNDVSGPAMRNQQLHLRARHTLAPTYFYFSHQPPPPFLHFGFKWSPG